MVHRCVRCRRGTVFCVLCSAFCVLCSAWRCLPPPPSLAIPAGQRHGQRVRGSGSEEWSNNRPRGIPNHVHRVQFASPCYQRAPSHQRQASSCAPPCEKATHCNEYKARGLRQSQYQSTILIWITSEVTSLLISPSQTQIAAHIQPWLTCPRVSQCGCTTRPAPAPHTHTHTHTHV